MLNFILAAALALHFAPQTATFIPNVQITIAQEPQEERYIIVYVAGGETHAVIIPHPVNCDIIRQVGTLAGIQILDCGSEFGTPGSNQGGAEVVSEAQALQHFGLDAWPTK